MTTPLPSPPPADRTGRPAAPTEESTGDPGIDAALNTLTELDPEDLDAHLASAAGLLDLLQARLADSGD